MLFVSLRLISENDKMREMNCPTTEDVDIPEIDNTTSFQPDNTEVLQSWLTSVRIPFDLPDDIILLLER